MASRVGGIIVRMSFNLGLHRCPARFPNFGPHDVSMRKRLWWSVYCLDRVVCQTLGLPLGIRDDDIDVCLPSEELHKLRDSQNNSTSLQGQCHESEQLPLLTVMSKHAKLRGMILELRNKSIRFRYEDTERALQVQAELKKWVNEVYDLTNTHLLSRNSPSENERGGGTDTADDCMHSSHRILLAILQHELTLSFHRPLLSSDLGTASSQAAFQECINASKAIIDTVASTSQNSRQEEPNLKHGHLLWPSLTWSVWMSCFVLTYAAIEGVITAVSAMRQVFSSALDPSMNLVLIRLIYHRYANRALRVLKLLSLRKTSWPEKCTLAVEQLIAFLDDRGCNEGQSLSTVRRSQRASSLQSRNLTDTSETPAAHSHDHATSLTPNYNKPREDGRSFRPRNTSVNISGSVDCQFQNVPPPSSTDFPAVTGPQEFSMAGFPGFTSNAAFEYAGTQGLIGADPLSALDFANFAQGPTVPSMPDFSFGFNGFN
ncbi:hypothetical protein NUW58_g7939 [Xylaria curta]|uniref:Uncharacterized protein n=1 Tax=Xylaria curta TaxID=42375 RepID=A0ACC1NDQ8_9PEZI|nr:hypothetical protein NUW58_g7939 [Xylaria curta]